jgi:hypothetical protein
VLTATPSNASVKKTVKRLSKLAWWVVHVPLAVHHAVAVPLAVALVVAAQAEAQGATAAEVADKAQRRCSKNAVLFKGNPLKRLK